MNTEMLKDMGNTDGAMVVLTTVFLRKEKRMVKEFGKKQLFNRNAINIMVNIKMI